MPINIIGHITFDELRRDLTQTDMANGFANRIAFACVRRSKLLPRGGGVVDLTGITPRLTRILAQRPAGELTRTGAAWEIWEQAYPALTEERPGMLGAILGRGAPQVLRLAVTYARLDRASEIAVPHLGPPWPAGSTRSRAPATSLATAWATRSPMRSCRLCDRSPPV